MKLPSFFVATLLILISSINLFASDELTFPANGMGLALEADGIGRGLSLTYKLKNLDDPMNTDTIKSISIVQDFDLAFGAGNYDIVGAPLLLSGPDTIRLEEDFDGSSNTELISAGYLTAGDSLVIRLSIQLNRFSDQGSGFGIYSIQAFAMGNTEGGTVSDLSHRGTNPDPNDNGVATDEDIPTSYDALEEQPRIGVAKNAIVRNDTVDFDFYIRNFSNRDFISISIPDNLDSVFGPGNYVIASPATINGASGLVANPSFNGSSDVELISTGPLPTDTEVVLSFSVKVTNQVDRGLGVGTYENQVKALATTASGNVAEDVSDMGKDPAGSRNDDVRNPEVDKPTRFEMSTNTSIANPVIGVSHTASVSGDFVTLDYYIENLGDVELSDVILEHDLDEVFGEDKYILSSDPSIIFNPGTITIEESFDGSQKLMLLTDSRLAVGANAHIQLIIEIDEVTDPLFVALGNYRSQVYAGAEGPQFGYTEDLSDNGTDPDPNGNNNPTNPGEDDPTLITVTPRAAIGIAKDMYVDDFLFGGTIPRVAVEFTIRNLGNVPLTNVELLDDLNSVYGASNFIHIQGPLLISGDDLEGFSLTLNNVYNGSSNTSVVTGGRLDVNEIAVIQIKHDIISITDQGIGAGMYQNQVTVTAIDQDSNPVSDISDSGVVVDSNNNGVANDAGEDDPTMLDVNFSREIGVALDASVTEDIVTFNLYIENLGSSDLFEYSLEHDFDDVFGTGNYTLINPPAFIDDPGTLLLNSNFTGNLEDAQLFLAKSNLGAGETAQLTYQVRVDNIANQGIGLGNYSSQVTLRALPDRGAQISDQSDFGTDPDPNGNGVGNEAGENDQTTFSLSPIPTVGVSLTSSVTDTIVTYDIYLENLSSVAASDISLVDNLDEVFGEGNYVIQTSPSFIVDPGTLTLKGDFNGSDNTELFSSGSTLNVGSTAQIQFVVRITSIEDQGFGAGIYSNQVEVSNLTNFNVRISDLSDDGMDPDPNGNGNPGDAGEDDPTTTVLSGGSIGAALNAIVSGTTVTLEFTVENLGRYPLSNIKASLPLNPIFGSGNYSISSQPTLVSGPSTLLLSPQFFGFNIFSNVIIDGTLHVGEKVVLRTIINVETVSDQGEGFGIYSAQFTVNADDPAGNLLMDDSDEGFEVDSNNNNVANDTGEGDATFIRIGDEANIGAALDVSTSADTVTFDYYIENFGTSILSSIELDDDLDDVFGVGNYSILGSPILVSGPATIMLESGYDGGSNTALLSSGSTLSANTTAQIRSVVVVTTPADIGFGIGRYQNQFSVTAESPLGSATEDLSDAGTDPDPNDNSRANDSDEDDISFFEIDFPLPSIGVALHAEVNCNLVDLTYTIQNVGNRDLLSVNISDDLDAVYGLGNYTITKSPQPINTVREFDIIENYDGSSNTALASGIIRKGITEQIGLQIRITNWVDFGDGLGVYNHQVTVDAVSEGGAMLSDLSDAGLDPDANDNRVTSEMGEDDVTIYTVDELPMLTVSTNSPVCIGQPIGLMDTGDGSAWIWYHPNGDTLSMIQNPVIDSAELGDAGIYKVIVFDEKGCRDSTTTSVIINSLPSVSIQSVSPVCLTDTIKLFEMGGDAVSWNWSGPNASFTSTDQNPIVADAMKVDSGMYTVVATDVNGCIDSLTTPVVVNSLPQVMIPNVAPVCLADTIKLSESGGDAVSWDWSSPNVSFSSNDQMPIVTNSMKVDSGNYKVIVTDINGCIDSVTTSVVVNSLPQVKVPIVAPVCLSDTIKLSETGGEAVNWNWSGPDVSFSSNNQMPFIANSLKADSGTYKVIVTDVNGCIDSVTTSVVVNSLPQVDVPMISAVCLADSIKLKETGGEATSWNWSGPNASFTSTDQNPIVANAMKIDSGEYKVIVTDINGCIDSVTTSVVVNSLPIVELPVVAPVCLTDSIKLNETGGDAISWEWSGPDASFKSNDQMPFIANSMKADSGTYQVIVTDINGCVDSVTTSVVVNSLPQVKVPIVAPVCLSDTIKLSETGGEAVNWNWSGPNVSFSSNNQMPFIANSLKADSGTYQVIVTDVNGCIDSVTTSVVVNSLPQVDVPMISAVCLADSIKLKETGGEATSWNWSGPNASFTSTDQNPIVANAMKIDSGEYKVIVTDINGCIDSVTTSVVVNSLPIVELPVVAPVCLTDSIKLTETGGDAISWEWSGPDASFSSNEQMPFIANSMKADSGTYQVIVTDINGCIDSVTTSVVVNSLPQVKVPIVAPVCLSDTIKLSETGGEAVNWNWSGPNVSFSSNNQMPFVTNSLKADSGTYQVIVTDVNGCIDSVTTSVVVNSLPQVDVPMISAVCLADSIKLKETGGEATSWNWSGPNASFTSTDQNPIVANAMKIDSGEYKVIVTDINGCIDSATTSVVVNSLPIVELPVVAPVCLTDSIKLNETGGDAISWEWSGPDASFSSNEQMPFIANSMKADSGTYKVIVTDLNGCVDSTTVGVVVNSLPEVTATSNTAICQGETIKLMASGSPNVSWLWSNESDYSSVVQNPTIGNASIASGGEYTVQVTDGNGCKSSDTAEVIVRALPDISIDAPSEVCLGDSILLSEIGGDGVVWSWTGPPNSSISSMLQSALIPLSTKSDSGVYQVTVSDNNGCIDSISTSIIVNDLPEISISSNSGLCEGTDLLLREVAGDAISWEWSGPNGFMEVTQSPVLSQVTTDNIGNYTVAVADANGCKWTDSIDIAVDLIPIIQTNIIGPSEICEGIDDLSYTIAAVDNADIYEWNYTLATTLIEDGSNTALFPSAVPGGTLSVIATNNCGSSSPTSIELTQASAEVCGLVTCLRKDAFIDNGVTSVLGNQLLIRVSEVISANMSLPTGGSARFTAGEAVDLYPGLQIAQQALFTVEIESCELVPALIEAIQKKD